MSHCFDLLTTNAAFLFGGVGWKGKTKRLLIIPRAPNLSNAVATEVVGKLLSRPDIGTCVWVCVKWR